jgi:hypothetical protein
MENEMGILSPEQVERIKARDRKRAQRAREKSAEGAAQSETPEAFWQRHKDAASSSQIAGLLARQDYVLNLLQTMSDAMTGAVSPELLFPDEVNADVKADVAQHGFCQMEIVLLDFWKHPEMIPELVMNEPTKTFLNFGILTALPDHKLHEWNEWMESQPANQQSLYTSPVIKT